MTNSPKFKADSFDRFGDDLCRLILSYLPINDCFRVECVSKQWKRSLFKNSGQTLVLKKTDTEHESIDNAFRKCDKVETIHLNLYNKGNIKSQTIEFISNYSRNLKSLVVDAFLCDVSQNSLISLRNNCGNTLETLSILNEPQIIRELITFCPNLKTVKCLTNYSNEMNNISLDLSILTDNNGKSVLPRLECMEMISIEYKEFEIFTNSYSEQIKELSVALIEPNLRTTVTLLSRFVCLERLVIDLDITYTHETVHIVNNGLIIIGEKCTKLIEMEIWGYDSGNRVYHSRNKFLRLKKLSFFSEHIAYSNPVTFELLMSCPNLKYLALNFFALNDQILKVTYNYLPNLRYLIILSENCNNSITNATLFGLSKLIHLTAFIVEKDDSDYYLNEDCNYHINDDGVCDMLTNCDKLRIITFECYTSVSQTSLNAFTEKAKQYPKRNYKFTALLKEHTDLITDGLPNNLMFDFFKIDNC